MHYKLCCGPHKEHLQWSGDVTKFFVFQVWQNVFGLRLKASLCKLLCEDGCQDYNGYYDIDEVTADSPAHTSAGGSIYHKYDLSKMYPSIFDDIRCLKYPYHIEMHQTVNTSSTDPDECLLLYRNYWRRN